MPMWFPTQTKESLVPVVSEVTCIEGQSPRFTEYQALRLYPASKKQMQVGISLLLMFKSFFCFFLTVLEEGSRGRAKARGSRACTQYWTLCMVLSRQHVCVVTYFISLTRL